MSAEPEIEFKVGDKVRHADYGEGVIASIDYNDPYVPYSVKYDGSNYTLWAENGSLSLVAATVVLSPEKAIEVREALMALGWNREDLGPLAEEEKPKRYIKADVAFPADDGFYQALEALEETACRWGGTITF